VAALTRLEIHAGPDGSAYGDGSEGYPVRSLAAALRIARARRAPGSADAGTPVVIWLHRGELVLTETLELGPEDDGTTFAAWPGDEGAVTVSGGRSVTGWTQDELRGRPVWTAPAAPDAGRSLYVAGERRERPRHPADRELRVADQDGLDLAAGLESTLFDGADAFRYAEGDVPELLDPSGVEVVVPHYWIQERMPVGEVDSATRTIRSPYRSILSLRDGDAPRFARYYLDGVVDDLGLVPGQWYLDRHGVVPTRDHPRGAGTPVLLYAPRPGEDPATLTAVVPSVGVLVAVRGDASRPARDIRFEGIAFRYADWPQAPSARPPFQMREDPVLADVAYASDPQAASTVPGAVELAYVRDCALVDCTVEHVGGYGVRLGAGSRGVLVSGCTLRDLGAGAVSCGGDADPASPGFSRSNEISDNEIAAGGRVYPHAVALLLRHGAGNVVAHNHVHDFFSTAIAVGWRWDYGPNGSTDNLVVGNHLHDLGQGRLDWFGAIYTLGVSPGTVLRGNLVHDVRAASFGGWGILIDPATSHVVVEDNVVHSVSSECLHVKSGRENVVRHNVLAFGGTGQVSLAVPEGHVAATLQHNVLVGSGTPAFSGAPGSASVRDLAARRGGLRSELNLVWDVRDGADAVLAGDGAVPDPETAGTAGTAGTVPWLPTDRADDAWRASGRDAHSVVADPGVVLTADGGLRLDALAAARAVGFDPAPARTPGPRPVTDRPHPGCSRVTVYRPAEVHA